MVQRGQLAGRGGRIRAGRRLRQEGPGSRHAAAGPRSPRAARRRWRFGAALTVCIAVLVWAAGPASAASPLSLTIVGNHFVDGAGNTIRLLGVDRPGTEYACEQGWGDSSGDLDAADAAAIAAWHANAVRIPLNEDCWLGINNEPAYGTMAAYRQTVEDYVDDLNADGIYAILDLHWSAPGTVVADEQRPMPDDHSGAFWTSVAGTFKTDPAVVFDAFNEPYSPAGNYPVSWSCWRSGGCTVPDAADGTTPDPTKTYTAAGMQQMVDTIRDTGATQPIMLGGLAYANDLTGWLANEPVDPDGQLAASVHVYTGEACADDACWTGQLAPVAAQVPVVTGEFDEDDCSTSFDDDYMNWADADGVSYLAWGWYVLTGANCDALYLVTDASGTPAAPNGVAVHDHLAALAAAGGGGGGATGGGGGGTGGGGGGTGGGGGGTGGAAGGTGGSGTGTTPSTSSGGTSSTTGGSPSSAGRTPASGSSLASLIRSSLKAVLAEARRLAARSGGPGTGPWRLPLHAPAAGELTVEVTSAPVGRGRQRLLLASGTRRFTRALSITVVVRFTRAERSLRRRSAGRIAIAVRASFVPAEPGAKAATTTIQTSLPRVTATKD